VSTDAVLADIDGALAAYGTVSGDWVSPDAMAWSPQKPELVICHGTGLLMPERWNVWQHDTYVQVVLSVDVSAFMVGVEALGHAVAQWNRTVADLAHPMAAAIRCFEDVGKVIADAFGFSFANGALHWHAEDAPRRVLLRCPACHPHANPAPLAIDGHAYRHRQLRRTRRRH
jgi:hypothetical protein